MFHKRSAMIKAGVVAMGIALGLLGAQDARAQQFNMNLGCPTLGSENIGKYTIDELNCLCHGGSTCEKPEVAASQNVQSATTETPQQMAATNASNSLSCDQHRALAEFARMNPGFVEGQTSQAIVDKYCDGDVPGSSVPQGSQVGGDLLSGRFRFERGYNTQYSGAKGRICKTYYSGDAYLERGKIIFTSGGHTWRGTISQNSFVTINRDGVTPRPKNPTSISGPMLNAELYNGYCGYGFFRLSAQ